METTTFEEFCQEYNIGKLNEQQETAVRQTEGPVLLLAVPGSGKTTVLITHAGYLKLAHGVPSTNILCLTYTKAAALEMKERYCKKFRVDQREAPYFSTINAFCNQVLITCSREKGEHLPKILENSDRILRMLLKCLHFHNMGQLQHHLHQ